MKGFGGFFAKGLNLGGFVILVQANLLGFFVLTHCVGSDVVGGKHQQRLPFLSASRMMRLDGFCGFLGLSAEG